MNDIKHFTNNPETKGIAEVKISANDNAYGVTWAEVVREYLKTGYTSEGAGCEVEAFGKNYKVLKRENVTTFYDAEGNTLFDVTHDRLQKEYEWLMASDTANGSAESGEEPVDVEEQEEPVEEGNDGAAEEMVTDPEKEEENKKAGEAAEQKPEQTEEPKEPVYAGVEGAVAKLKAELTRASEKDKTFAEPCIEYLIKRCEESESMAADVCQNHKTWAKCYKFIYEKAKKALNSISGPVRSDTVFEWAEDYYHKDDKAEEEAKAKKEAEAKAKREKDAAKKKSDHKNSTNTVTKSQEVQSKEKSSAEKKEDVAKPKQESPKSKPKKTNELEGQLDLFSLMGM